MEDYNKFKRECVISIKKHTIKWKILTICLRAILSVCDFSGLSGAICNFAWVCVRNV